MKKICVTYHMERAGETAETCIELPMIEEFAVLLELGVDTWDVVVQFKAAIARMVNDLAHMQGYTSGTIQDIRYASHPETTEDAYYGNFT